MAKGNIFYNAHHCPIGAMATFTLGMKGNKGGFGIELSKPSDQNIYIGLQDAVDPVRYNLLPFFKYQEDESSQFDVEKTENQGKVRLKPFPSESIERDYQLTSDI